MFTPPPIQGTPFFSDRGERRRSYYYDTPPREQAPPEPAEAPPQPVDTENRSFNALRPRTFDEVIGQERVKTLISRMVDVAKRDDRPLDHVLLVGSSGTGKTTLAHVIANELQSRVFQLEAPISHDTLVQLASAMRHRDILFLDEIHQQAIQERRGKSSATQPEVLFGVMEDRVLATSNGIIEFPRITIIGGTTDEGMLPDAFINRFPLRPRLERYSVDDLQDIAYANGDALGVDLTYDAARTFAHACRGVPREINNYVRNCAMLGESKVDTEIAIEVVTKLNSTTLDGLNSDMQNMLTFLYTRGRRETKDGDVSYKASVSTIATAIGKSRDAKAIVLRVEPYLIEKGYVQVGHGGRSLTDEGIQRARELLET